MTDDGRQRTEDSKARREVGRDEDRGLQFQVSSWNKLWDKVLRITDNELRIKSCSVYRLPFTVYDLTNSLIF
jgi:hypothetical protein